MGMPATAQHGIHTVRQILAYHHGCAAPGCTRCRSWASHVISMVIRNGGA